MRRLDGGPWPSEHASFVIPVAPRRDVVVVHGTDGRPRAFLNECQHIPIPLDSGTRRFLDVWRTHLVCLTHGATYRVDTGECIAGPCEGDVLTQYEVEVLDGHLYVYVPDPDPLTEPLG